MAKKKKIVITSGEKLYIAFKCVIALCLSIGIYGVVVPQYVSAKSDGELAIGVCLGIGYTFMLIYLGIREYESYKKYGKGII